MVWYNIHEKFIESYSKEIDSDPLLEGLSRNLCKTNKLSNMNAYPLN